MSPEARRHLAVPIPVGLLRPDGIWETEYAVNLSAGGLCLHLRNPIPEGQAVRVSFEIPNTGQKFETAARIVWVTREDQWGPRLRFYEMGIAFTGLDAQAQQTLRRYAASIGA